MKRLDATRLRERADLPPTAARATLAADDGTPIGSLEAELAHACATPAFRLQRMATAGASKRR